ncbi:hypothetical protein D9758_011222 [Tetrapyrgos nigripes]|uniref:Uncharacterized protein n=1 Tax=Tetrapyrgos nigripes TaxID=182062 RepID=A0A8H5D6G5_9AGAR|nr:hypothetical protein D9758_011222 [Tetrapyrgos nigripes]
MYNVSILTSNPTAALGGQMQQQVNSALASVDKLIGNGSNSILKAAPSGSQQSLEELFQGVGLTYQSTLFKSTLCDDYAEVSVLAGAKLEKSLLLPLVGIPEYRPTEAELQHMEKYKVSRWKLIFKVLWIMSDFYRKF